MLHNVDLPRWCYHVLEACHKLHLACRFHRQGEVPWACDQDGLPWSGRSAHCRTAESTLTQEQDITTFILCVFVESTEFCKFMMVGHPLSTCWKKGALTSCTSCMASSNQLLEAYQPLIFTTNLYSTMHWSGILPQHRRECVRSCMYYFSNSREWMEKTDEVSVAVLERCRKKLLGFQTWVFSCT